MRSKKLMEILKLLPSSPEVDSVKQKLAEKSAKTSEYIKKLKRWGSIGVQVYLAIFWAVQSLIDMGFF